MVIARPEEDCLQTGRMVGYLDIEEFGDSDLRVESVDFGRVGMTLGQVQISCSLVWVALEMMFWRRESGGSVMFVPKVRLMVWLYSGEQVALGQQGNNR